MKIVRKGWLVTALGVLMTIAAAQVLTWAWLGKRHLAVQVAAMVSTLSPPPYPTSDCDRGLLVDHATIERTFGVRGASSLVAALTKQGWVVWDGAAVPEHCYEDTEIVPGHRIRVYKLGSELIVGVEEYGPVTATIWVGRADPNPLVLSGGSQEYRFAWVLGRWIKLPIAGRKIQI